jgi:hypothetical protein
VLGQHLLEQASRGKQQETGLFWRVTKRSSHRRLLYYFAAPRNRKSSFFLQQGRDHVAQVVF